MSETALTIVSAFAVVLAVFCVATVILNRRFVRRMRVLAADRAGESICQFVRSLPFRELDTTIIRDVYETLETTVSGSAGCPVPIHTDDLIRDTLEIDVEDLEDLVVEIAKRRGRSLDHCELNPFYNQTSTPGVLVRFLCAQPKMG